MKPSSYEVRNYQALLKDFTWLGSFITRVWYFPVLMEFAYDMLSGLTYNIHKFGSKALFPPELKIKKANFNQKLYST